MKLPKISFFFFYGSMQLGSLTYYPLYADSPLIDIHNIMRYVLFDGNLGFLRSHILDRISECKLP